MMSTTKAYAGTQAVVRALRLLKLFAGASPELTFGELKERSQLNRSTAFRLLTALEAEGMVERNPATDAYRLGPQVAALGRRAGGGNLRELAEVELSSLSARTNETATLEVLAERDVAIVAESTGDQRLGAMPSVGTTWPAHATSTGKVLLAFSSDVDRDRALAGTLARFTERTLTTRDELERELRGVRAKGRALSIGELEEGYAAVSVPVRDAMGRVVAALSVGGPKDRLARRRLDSIAVLLGESAARIQSGLGA